MRFGSITGRCRVTSFLFGSRLDDQWRSWLIYDGKGQIIAHIKYLIVTSVTIIFKKVTGRAVHMLYLSYPAGYDFIDCFKETRPYPTVTSVRHVYANVLVRKNPIRCIFFVFGLKYCFCKHSPAYYCIIIKQICVGRGPFTVRIFDRIQCVIKKKKLVCIYDRLHSYGLTEKYG